MQTTTSQPPAHGHQLDDTDEYTPPSLEHPVFVTHDGRPRWRGRLMASSLALILTAWLAAIVVGGSGFTSMPTLQLAPLAHRPALASHSAHLKSAAERRERRRDSRDLARAAAKQPKPAST